MISPHILRAKLTKLLNLTPDDSFNLENTRDVPQFSAFTPLTLEKTQKLITASANKTCSLDPIPTCLVKACAVELSPCHYENHKSFNGSRLHAKSV